MEIGMQYAELKLHDVQHHVHPMTNPVWLAKHGADIVVKAEGIYLYTDTGRQIIDMGSGLANVNIGYGNPRLCMVAYDAMQQLSFAHSQHGRSNPWAAALGAKLTEITPDQFQHFFFASTGSDAIESACKMALRHWRLLNRPSKRAFISRRMSYHGNTLFAASLTGLDEFHAPFGLPISDQIYHVEPADWYREGKGRSSEQYLSDLVNGLEQQIIKVGPENICAFISDPIPSAVVAPHGYWPEVRRLCDRYDLLLIADEVISGFGKTGRMFGFQNFDFEPDMIVMAKGMTSGYFPMSAVGIGRRVADVMQKADELFAHVFTNCGHPVGAAVALENIAVIEEGKLLDRVRFEIGPHFSTQMQTLQELPGVGTVETFGVFGRLEIDLSKIGRRVTQAENDLHLDKIVDIAWRRGVATKGGGLCLPMIVTTQQIDTAVDILKEAILEAVGE